MFWTLAKITEDVATTINYWRREWDSNPRYACTHTRFPSVRLKPLGHLSRRSRGPIALQAISSSPPSRRQACQDEFRVAWKLFAAPGCLRSNALPGRTGGGRGRCRTGRSSGRAAVLQAVVADAGRGCRGRRGWVRGGCSGLGQAAGRGLPRSRCRWGGRPITFDDLRGRCRWRLACQAAQAAARAAGNENRGEHQASILRAARKALWGISTLPNWRMRFLPSFCLSRSLRLRLKCRRRSTWR